MKKFLFLVLAFALQGCGFSVVDPGNRGVKVHMGTVDTNLYPEGVVWHQPLLTKIVEVSIRQQTKELKCDDYSSDLQQVIQNVKVLYRIPEGNVIDLYRKYQGDPWDSLVEPRVQETMHELTALITAENIVKTREKIKADALALVKKKLGDLVEVIDIVIVNETLSKELEAAIESKMVQQQETSKAQFIKEKTKVEAETAILRAEGEARALSIQGEAIRRNPETLQMETIKKWNGVTPLVVGSGSGTNILLPVTGKKE